MLLPAKSAIFVHVPKTGGNSITQLLVKTGRVPQAVLTIKDGQDGRERFGLRDQITSRKHASLQEQIESLLAIDPDVKKIEAVFVGRLPLDRLSSLALHGSQGRFSPVHIFNACFKAKSTSDFLRIPSRLGMLLEARSIALTVRCLNFYDLESEVTRWLGENIEQRTSSSDNPTKTQLPNANASKATAVSRTFTRVFVKMLLPLTSHIKDKKLFQIFEQESTQPWTALKGLLSTNDDKLPRS